jgi:NACalpha-BTF3-like transcription factor
MHLVSSRLVFASSVLALTALAGCPKGGVPGAGGLPGGMPGGHGGESGMVDPNTCGNYAVSDAGRKLKDFLVATQQLQTTTDNTIHVVRESCAIMGRELGMLPTELEGETKDVCARVYGKLDEAKKVAFKGKAALVINYKPAVCKVNVEAQAKAAAECEGKASADIKATCSGTCNGTCDGTCSGKAGTGGSGGQCNGQCSGACHGDCDGHADVNASAQCKASASVKASADVQCTEPELDVKLDAKLVLDKTKADQAVAALKAGLPKIFSVKARLGSLKYAAEVWAMSAKELSGSARTLAMSFKDQAACISGQIAAAASAVGSIQANVSVSVEVSASASGQVGG